MYYILESMNKEYPGVNIIVNLLGFCIFKSNIISEKRTTLYIIDKLLKVWIIYTMYII